MYPLKIYATKKEEELYIIRNLKINNCNNFLVLIFNCYYAKYVTICDMPT